jgi:ribosome-binding ATPase YchF (GTP1/OBG family)
VFYQLFHDEQELCSNNPSSSNDLAFIKTHVWGHTEIKSRLILSFLFLNSISYPSRVFPYDAELTSRSNQVEVINPLFLLTAKPVVYLVNLSEKDYIRQRNKYLPKVAEWIKENAAGDPIIPISVSFEERLTRFESDAEAEEECKKLGTKSALPKVIVTMRQALNLGSFFTTGADEVRQWTIRKGTKAPQAAGVIHTGMLNRPLCLKTIT